MPHAFSVEIQDFLSEKIHLAEDGKKKAKQENNVETCSYFDGQLLELKALRQYLTDNIDLKTQKYF